MTRPTRQQANRVKHRGRMGHDEDQLARGIGVTRETMRGFAKFDPYFAQCLREGLDNARRYWEKSDESAK